LLPAMSNEPAEERASQHRLTEKVSSLRLPPVHGRATSPISAQVSSRTYLIDPNNLKIETIALNFTASGCTVSLKTAVGEETIPCGFGVWQQGQTTLFNDSCLFDPKPIVASGAWTAEESFTMVVRLYETPFFHTLVYHFIGDEMLVETWVNVSLESTKTLLLTAHPA
jgi:hypothetical protein